MNYFKNNLNEIPKYKNLISKAKINKNIAINNITSTACANLINSVCLNLNRRAFVLCKNEEDAIEFVKDLNTMGISALFYPLRDFCFLEAQADSKEFEHKRIKALYSFLNKKVSVLVMTLQAALQASISAKTLGEFSFTLKPKDNIEITTLKNKLISCGYENSTKVEGIGQFSSRGDIFDLFSPMYEKPIRIEFFGNEIENIYFFDINTQRREKIVKNIRITPCKEVIVKDKNKLIEKLKELYPENLKDIQMLSSGEHISSYDKFLPLIFEESSFPINYLNKDDMVFINDFSSAKAALKASEDLLNEEIKALIENNSLIFEENKFTLSLNLAEKNLKNNFICYLETFVFSEKKLNKTEIFDFNIKNLSPWHGSFKELRDEISKYLSQNYKICMFAANSRSAKKIIDELLRNEIPCEKANKNTLEFKNKIVYVFEEALNNGFEVKDKKSVVLTYLPNTRAKKRHGKFHKKGLAVTSIDQFEIDDYVVHSMYGIGMFKGVHRLEMQGVTKDFIKILYAKNDILYVPVTQLDMVAKYIGSKEDKTVKLNNINTKEWQKQKSKAKSHAQDIAKDLIKIYSKRMQAKGHAFAEDNDWQRDFELRFEYEETDDQIISANEIKQDMQSSKPMDRLLCGDVGVGKTEVAFRAAFKCVQDNKQCAFLVPTTILAWQHYKTAVERFKDFPVNIDFLSRFKTKKEQKEVLKKLERGDLDIVIGTHRLVQNDIKFKNLGLVIIDEEQRFGVLQKEKFKNMAENIDILTLSATPIPRTLNMALAGIRDMSSIEEAPRDRLPVQTYVLEYNELMIIESIKKELRRNGQVYYLKNNINALAKIARKLSLNLPNAKIEIAHSKMNEEELALIWQKLLNKEIDILVCTTIIEAGIDVPNVNTIIVEDADRFGLSQLHQIRGRVGRSFKRAYAYFTFKKSKVISEIANKRLLAIKDFTEFGSGFKISMRDLEIRGAGNLLGGQQHGCMDSVGYDMYMKLLSVAFDNAKNLNKKQIKEEQNCLIDIKTKAFIPEEYIQDLQERLIMYKKIALVRNNSDADEVLDELCDRYGKYPESVKTLVDISIAKNLASKLNIYEIRQKDKFILLFTNNINMKSLAHLIAKSSNKILFSAGTKPYISIEINPKQSTIKTLSENLKILQG